MTKGGSVYIVTNKNHTVLYTGVSSELYNRIIKHKQKYYPFSFSARYNANKLVWHEEFTSITEAIAREKQIKAGSRKKKLALIEAMNPEWNDLIEEL